MTGLRCSVIIPARNEAGAIAEVVRRVRETLPAEVIVVDNNSNDDTAAVAAAAGARVVHESARGYGHACLRGIAAAARPDVIVFIDGDGSMSPEDIPKLLEPIESDRAEVVCGSRRRRALPGSMPAHQAFGNWLAVKLLLVLYRVRLSDLGPFRAIRASTLHSLEMRPSRFAFLAEMLARAAVRGARITEVDVDYRTRLAGDSKVGGSLRGSLEAGTEIITSLLWNRFSQSGLAWLVGLLASLAFFLLAWLRYASFHSTAYDLGFFDQVVWNAAHGHGLSSSFLEYSFFGQHFEPALLLFVPLYALHASPVWLLLGQSLALGLAVVPLFALARAFVESRRAFIVVAAYLLQLAVSRTVAFDFHTEALAVPFVFLALLALVKKRRLLFFAAAIVPLLGKEDGALVALSLGLMAVLVFRDRVGIFLAATALAWGALILLVVMPWYRHGLAGDLISRYQYLGQTPGDVVLHAVTRPATVAGELAANGSLQALLIALVGLGLLPLLRPGVLLIALIPIAPALLSSDHYQSQMALHYGIPGVPLLLTAAILGWQKLASDPSRRRLGGISLLAGALTIFALLSPLPRTLIADLPDLVRGEAVESVLRQIPMTASVAASTSLVPHLAERLTIDELPCGAGHASWIAVDGARAPSGQSEGNGYRTVLATLGRQGYRPVASSGAVTVWYAAGAGDQAPAACFPSR